MAIYAAMEPPVSDQDARQEKALLLRDGFRLLAFLFPVVWLLWHRLWIEALAAFALTLAGAALAQWADQAVLGTALALLTNLYFGLEAGNLRIHALRRRGWTFWGVVDAGDRVEAELRYAAEAAEEEPAPPSVPESPVSDRTRPTARPGMIGLVSYPWAR